MIRLRAALTARHSTLLAVLAVGASFAVVATAVALSGLQETLQDTLQEEPPVRRIQLHPPLVVPGPLARVRCVNCGVIEQIVVTNDERGAPASYQFAVRMNDGSLRLSSDTHPGRWQVGDGMQLLGGGRTWSER